MSVNLYEPLRTELYERYGRRCVYCGCELSKAEYELDHIVPKTKGGKSRISNLVLSCMLCNRRKNNNAPNIPIQLCFDLTKYRVYPKPRGIPKQQVARPVATLTEGKRPANATPERALELSKTLSQVEIARLWGITRQRVYQLIKKAKES